MSDDENASQVSEEPEVKPKKKGGKGDQREDTRIPVVSVADLLPNPGLLWSEWLAAGWRRGKGYSLHVLTWDTIHTSVPCIT